MSVFSSIMSKIFHRKEQPQAAPAPSVSAQPAQAPSAQQHATPAYATAPEPQVDVEAVLESMAKDAGQTLDWRHSIVDLMKLLSIDSSLENRKELARELGYTGDTGDSATMNIWLHKQVMTKLAENGGIVPNSLR